MGHDVGLDVTVVVLEGEDETSVGFDHLGNEVIDEAMLVPELVGVEVFLVLGLEDLLEEVFEVAVVLLEDGVLGAEHEGHFPHECVGEGLVGEVDDGLVGVVHAETNTALASEVEDGSADWSAVVGSEDELELSRLVELHVLALVLVSIGVPADDDGVSPAGDEAGDVFADDGLTEDCAVEDGSDGAVG